MCKVMSELGVAIDGGKDSLSMAARVGKETVKAPGACVFMTEFALVSVHVVKICLLLRPFQVPW